MHNCPGESCSYLVNTGESWVCSITGKCLQTTVMQVSYDYLASSSQTQTKKYAAPVTEIYSSCAAGTQKYQKEESKKQDVYGECFRVVKTLLGKENKLIDKKSNNGAVKIATKKAQALFKKHTDKKKRQRLLPAVFEFLQTFQKVKQTGGAVFKDELLDGIARRCQKCCEMSLMEAKSPPVKIKVNYICIAALYMLREGVTVKGVQIAKRDEDVKRALPNLNSIHTFGFQKSKYTKAERFVREALQTALYTKPIHSITF